MGMAKREFCDHEWVDASDTWNTLPDKNGVRIHKVIQCVSCGERVYEKKDSIQK